MPTEILSIETREDGSRVVKRRLEDVAKSSDKAGKSFLSLKKILGGLTAGLALRQLVRYTNQFAQLQNRLRVVTKGTEDLTRATEELFAISQRTRSSFTSTAELYSRLALATKDLGIEQDQLFRFTERVNKAIIVSGASSQEAQAGLIQLSQGLASGALRGDELRSVLEQLPAVADIIAKQMGVTRGALRDMGTQGLITAEVVLDAFENAGDDIEKKFLRTIITLPQGFQVLQNSLVKTVGEMDKITGSSNLLANALVSIAEVLPSIISGFQTTVDVIAAVGSEFVVLGNYLGKQFKALVNYLDGPFLTIISNVFGSIVNISFKDFLVAAAVVTDTIIGLFNGLGQAIGVSIGGVERIITAGFGNAINGALRFVEGGVNSIIDTINKLSGKELFQNVDFSIPANVDTGFTTLGADIGEAFTSGLRQTAAQDLLDSILSKTNERGRLREVSAKKAAAAEALLNAGEDKGNELLDKRAIALMDVNRELDNQSKFLGLNNSQRQIENDLVKIQEGLRNKGVILTEQENEGFRNRLKQLQVLKAQGELIETVTGDQEQLNVELQAYNKLLAEQPNLANAARSALLESSSELLEGTVAGQDLLVTDLERNLERIQTLRDADVISEQTANLAKVKANAEYNNQRLAVHKEGFAALETLSSSGNSKLAAIGKAAAIANATIDTYKAATGAYASLASIPYVGPVLGAAAAGAAIAAGLANVAKIRSQPTARALGGDINAGQLTTAGEASFGRAELFTGASGQQLFIPPERGRIEPLRAGQGIGQAQQAPSVNVAPAPVQVIVVDNENKMREFLASEEGQQQVVANISQNPEAVSQIVSNG